MRSKIQLIESDSQTIRRPHQRPLFRTQLRAELGKEPGFWKNRRPVLETHIWPAAWSYVSSKVERKAGRVVGPMARVVGAQVQAGCGVLG